MDSKIVWDVNDVYSFKDLVNNNDSSEAMLGSAFAILGVKGEELGDALEQWKARIALHGSNVQTKPDTSAADLFEEVSNAPASFAVARAARAVAAMKGFTGTLRDAETAYLQALMDTPTRTPTFFELPKERVARPPVC